MAQSFTARSFTAWSFAAWLDAFMDRPVYVSTLYSSILLRLDLFTAGRGSILLQLDPQTRLVTASWAVHGIAIEYKWNLLVTRYRHEYFFDCFLLENKERACMAMGQEMQIVKLPSPCQPWKKNPLPRRAWWLGPRRLLSPALFVPWPLCISTSRELDDNTIVRQKKRRKTNGNHKGRNTWMKQWCHSSWQLSTEPKLYQKWVPWEVHQQEPRQKMEGLGSVRW